MTFSWLSRTFNSQAPKRSKALGVASLRRARLSTLRGFGSKAAKLSFRLKPASAAVASPRRAFAFGPGRSASLRSAPLGPAPAAPHGNQTFANQVRRVSAAKPAKRNPAVLPTSSTAGLAEDEAMLSGTGRCESMKKALSDNRATTKAPSAWSKSTFLCSAGQGPC